MNYVVSQVNAFDGKNLCVHTWKNDGNTALICIHGMVEHGKRYSEFAEFLNGNNVDVFVPDLRGHGKTVEEKDTPGFIDEKDGWNILLSDVHSIYTYVSSHNYEKIFFLGHSMGSILLLNYLQSYDHPGDGSILSALTYKQDFLSDVGKLLSQLQGSIAGNLSKGKIQHKLTFEKFNKKFKPNRTDFDWLSRDESEVDAYIADPMCGFMPTARFFYDLADGTREIYRSDNLSKLSSNQRILLISGSKDPVAGGYKKSNNTYKLLSGVVPNTTHKVYEGGRHELLHETNREEVFADILNWIRDEKNN